MLALIQMLCLGRVGKSRTTENIDNEKSLRDGAELHSQETISVCFTADYVSINPNTSIEARGRLAMLEVLSISLTLIDYQRRQLMVVTSTAERLLILEDRGHDLYPNRTL